MQAPETGAPAGSASPLRRDILRIPAGIPAAAGVPGLAWPSLRSLAPAADLLAEALLGIDLVPIPQGRAIIVLRQGQGKPILLRRRTKADIARADDAASMPNPAPDDRIRIG